MSFNSTDLPAPWRIVPEDSPADEHVWIVSADNHTVAVCRRAPAELIVSAVNLLEAFGEGVTSNDVCGND